MNRYFYLNNYKKPQKKYLTDRIYIGQILKANKNLYEDTNKNFWARTIQVIGRNTTGEAKNLIMTRTIDHGIDPKNPSNYEEISNYALDNLRDFYE